MDLMYLLELAVNGGLAGLMYALVAMGIVLIYKSSSVPNLAQGGLTMLGAYMVLAFANGLGLPMWAAIPLAMVSMFGMGMGIERVALRRLAGRPIVMILMMTLGLVLTFATSFVAFSTIFYNIFIGGPDQIAGILTGTQGESATAVFAQKLDVVFMAIQQASGDTKDISAFSPPGMMWIGAMLLLLGTVGLLVTARIALALLLAVGPIFVVLALFEGTRGLFTGWLKGLTMMALAPLFAVLGGSIMLEMAVPVLAALVKVPGQIDQQAAMAFFLVGAVHMALMLLSLKVAGTMVAGWQVFGLVPEKSRERGGDAPRPVPVVQQVAPAAARNLGMASLAPALTPSRPPPGACFM